MFLLSTVNVLLYRFTGQKDILLGSPMAGRLHKDLEDQIGLFVNMLVFRTGFNPDMTFEELIAIVKKNALDTYHHSMYPFTKVMEELNNGYNFNRTNIFDVAVQLQNAKLTQVKSKKFEGITVSNFLPNSYSSKFDITFNFEDLPEDGIITMDVEYKTDLFLETTIDRMKQDLFTLFEAITKDKTITIKKLRSMLVQQDDQEQQAQLSDLIEKGISADY
jgi:non-ribosomal peptide synthetase component F